MIEVWKQSLSIEAQKGTEQVSTDSSVIRKLYDSTEMSAEEILNLGGNTEIFALSCLALGFFLIVESEDVKYENF